MTIWFTSDTHFGHTNIIRLCERPYEDSHAMDEDIIAKWNAHIKPEDTVWHLGDFSCNYNDWRIHEHIVKRLHGKKHIIIGNHDNHGFMKKCSWESIHEGIVEERFESNGTLHHFVLSHYPLREWQGFFRGAFHLYGHVHNNLKNYCRSMDVGVDTNNFNPYSLEDIISKLSAVKNSHGE